MAEQVNFKRINFFEGFFTTDEDWNAGEAYHLEKRRLHNRVLHTPGVVPVAGGGMKVQARGRGDLSFEVTPGYAVDGRGNELVVRDPAVKVVEADKLKLPQTIYVAIRYFEEPTDFIAYKENPRFKGHRRIEEKAKIEVMAREPDGVESLELGRVRLEEGVREIRDALDPRVPGPGEIDLRYVPVAGYAGSHASPQLRVEIANGLSEKAVLASLLCKMGVLPANYLRGAVLAAEMLNNSNGVGPFNLADVLTGPVELEREMVEAIEKDFPQIAARKGFAEYKKALEHPVGQEGGQGRGDELEGHRHAQPAVPRGAQHRRVELHPRRPPPAGQRRFGEGAQVPHRGPEGHVEVAPDLYLSR